MDQVIVPACRLLWLTSPEDTFGRTQPGRQDRWTRLTVRFLHTADWLIGKPLRGHQRTDEYARALVRVGAIARDLESTSEAYRQRKTYSAAPTRRW